MFDKLKVELNSLLQDENIAIDEIFYKKGRPNTLNVVITSSDVIDIDTVVKVTKMINPVIDKMDLIKDNYVLDVYSKERK